MTPWLRLEYHPTFALDGLGMSSDERRIMKLIRLGRTTPREIAAITGQPVADLIDAMDALCRRGALWKGVPV